MKKSILVVDDEPTARTMLRLILVRAGFDVVEAEDGHEAFYEIDQQKPDLMILDVMMPEIDGIEVCRRLRENKETADLPIIMLSARTDAKSIKLGFEVGANEYLTKPITPEELIRHVSQTLNI